MDKMPRENGEFVPEPNTKAWRTSRPVRFSDCDPAGIVYFARYFDMLNGVVEDWFCNALKIDYHKIIRDRRTGLGYASAHADYAKPSTMGDKLECGVVVGRIGHKSLTLHIRVHREAELILVARLVIVTTSLDTHRSIPLPDDIRAAIEAYQENSQ